MFPKPTNSELNMVVSILNRLQLYLSDKRNCRLYQGEIERYRHTIQGIQCWIDDCNCDKD